MRSQFKIVKNMGLFWTLFSIKYELKKKTGLLQKRFNPKSITNENFISNHIKTNQINDEETLLNYLIKNKNFFFFDYQVLT